ncbi:lipoprotein [Candidatus Hepatincola sp. Pdp]
MKKLYIVSTGIFLTLLSACSSSKITLDVKECNYPDSPSVSAPLWVCGAKVEGVGIAAVGSTKKSAAGYSFMQQQAAADARVLLAQQIKSDLNAKVASNTATSTSNTTEQESINSSSSLDVSQVTVQSLAGTRILKTVTSPAGYLYVLVGFDQATYDDYVNKVLKK